MTTCVTQTCVFGRQLHVSRQLPCASTLFLRAAGSLREILHTTVTTTAAKVQLQGLCGEWPLTALRSEFNSSKSGGGVMVVTSVLKIQKVSRRNYTCPYPFGSNRAGAQARRDRASRGRCTVTRGRVGPPGARTRRRIAIRHASARPEGPRRFVIFAYLYVTSRGSPNRATSAVDVL